MSPSKRKSNTRGRFLMIYRDVMDSHAWKAAPALARAFYVDLRSQVNGRNNGDIATATDAMRERGWTHPRTIAKYTFTLMALGLLTKTRQGGIGGQGRTCSLFAFPDEPVEAKHNKGITASMPTKPWTRFQSVEHARTEMAAGVAQLEAQARGRQFGRLTTDGKKKRRVHELNLKGAHLEPLTPFQGSHREVLRLRKVLFMNLGLRDISERHVLKFKELRRKSAVAPRWAIFGPKVHVVKSSIVCQGGRANGEVCA